MDAPLKSHNTALKINHDDCYFLFTRFLKDSDYNGRTYYPNKRQGNIYLCADMSDTVQIAKKVVFLGVHSTKNSTVFIID